MPQLAPWLISSLWFHCDCGPCGPRLGRVVQDCDVVLVAVLVAGLDSHDVRDGLALVRRGRRDVRGRIRGVVIGERAGGVACTGTDRSGAGCTGVHRARLALPRLDLWTGEDGAAVGVIRDGDARVLRTLGAGGDDVRTEGQAVDEAFEAPVLPHGERAGDVTPVVCDAHLGRAHAGRNGDLDERVAGRDTSARVDTTSIDRLARGTSRCGTAERQANEQKRELPAKSRSPNGRVETQYPHRPSHKHIRTYGNMGIPVAMLMAMAATRPEPIYFRALESQPWERGDREATAEWQNARMLHAITRAVSRRATRRSRSRTSFRWPV